MEHSTTELIARLVLQLGVILVAAKAFGEACERWLRQPAVLGELAAGMLLGPFALGALQLPGIGALFPRPEAAGAGAIPVSLELFAIAQIGAVVLLFLAGLETDLGMFLRYAWPATVVATGGAVASFAVGIGVTLLWGLDDSWMGAEALFIGTIFVATSVGITARVLSDIKKLDTPEGVTILGAAVVDDVIGIIVLTVVIALTRAGAITPWEVVAIVLKAVGFWLALVAVGILAGGRLSRGLRAFRTEGATLSVALGLCFLVAALAEIGAGLAMIIGAYAMGLALSRTEIARYLADRLAPVYHVLVPVFFAVMGMLVNFRATAALPAFAVVATLLAFASKIFGCGLPSYAVGFNTRGAWRIGLGMLPRGEVALIVAGMGIATGAIGADIYGVAVLITVATTLATPIVLVPAFRGPAGTRRAQAAAAAGGR